MLLLGAAACAVSAGCGRGDDDKAHGEETEATQQAYAPIPWDCNNPLTPAATFRAIPHSSGYTGPGGRNWITTPTPPPPPPPSPPTWVQELMYEIAMADYQKTHAYEVALWDNVVQSNGYAYLLQLISTNFKIELPDGGTGYMPTDHLIFGVGIEAQDANPSWYPSPPAQPVFPSWKGFFGVSSQEFAAETALATDPQYTAQPDGTNYPVNAIAWTCVTIVDETGAKIDFFPMMDEHDPSGLPW
jgi:hypothetical protein